MLKKAYEPMRGKKISVDSGNKLRKIIDKIENDKQALIQLMKADIPFVSSLAATRLITVHDMKGAEINKLKEETELDEAPEKFVVLDTSDDSPILDMVYAIYDTKRQAIAGAKKADKELRKSYGHDYVSVRIMKTNIRVIHMMI